ncbi:MAG: DUF4097 domain-containing protein [Ruminococcaceae bacterium]|nr:DUF4097 domain-containing protein [Oscillospiraceae bacterium]
MKLKRFFIPGILLLLAGILCFAAVFLKHGFDPTRLTPRVYVGKMADYEDVSSIIVDDKNASVRIMRADIGRVSVTYSDCDEEWYDLTWDGSTLRITKHEQFVFRLFSFDFYRPELIIAIPKDYDGVLNIETINGSIRAEDVCASDGYFTTMNGEIRVSGGFDSLRAHTTNGAVTLDGVAAPELISAVTTNGEVNFIILHANEVIVKTTNGEVGGSIVGDETDWQISASTVNGRNDLKNRTDGEKKLTVQTTNGSIGVQFVQTGK